MKDPNRKSFLLRKVKRLKSGGLQVDFTVRETAGGETYEREETHKNARDPHPDLLGRLDDFDVMLAVTLRFKELLTVVRSDEFKATKDQNKKAEKAYDWIIQHIDVNGLALSGQDDNRGVIIMGTLKTEAGPNVALNSPRLKFNATTYGFEEALEDRIDQLEEEVYQYIYKGKAAQLDMFSGGDEEEKHDGKKAAANDD